MLPTRPQWQMMIIIDLSDNTDRFVVSVAMRLDVCWI